MSERFQPPPHVRPDTLHNMIIYGLRLFVDFQFNTIHKHMKRFLPRLTGKIMDVGAGESPFRHMTHPTAAQYVGLDIYDAKSFGYENRTIEHFDGEHIPCTDNSVDHFFCTEVIEHVENPQRLIDEIFRVLKPGGQGAVTVPWSARFHYIPYDYHRFTPTRLKSLFKDFSRVTIEERGTDITTIISKIVVVYARSIVPQKKIWLVPGIPFSILLLPLLATCVALGHVSLWFHLGSADDPLGYTIWLEK